MKILGILNITADSFSDGGEFLDLSRAISHAEGLFHDGADAIDIGAQSSNANAIPIPAEEEWDKIRPVLKACKLKSIPVSVDTYKPSVIQKSLEAGVDYINNITAFRDYESVELLLEYKNHLPELVLMYSHDNGFFANLNSILTPENVTYSILSFFEKKIDSLLKKGIPLEKLIFDPGMGLFLSNDPQVSLKVLESIQELKSRFGRVMISVSRKSFIGNLLGGIPPKERGAGTLACEIFAYMQGVDFIRTHDAKSLYQSILILERLKQQN